MEALRRELTLGPWPVVLYSGNFEPYQGVELLLDALALVPHVQLLLMGGGPDDVARMKAEARGRGVGERCVFSGQRPPSDLPAFLALADVLASPRAKGQNTPFKIFTYLASGKSLVATRIPTHTQLLDDTTAFLVEPTPQGLASGIQAALDRPGGRGRSRPRRPRAHRARVQRRALPREDRPRVRGGRAPRGAGATSELRRSDPSGPGPTGVPRGNQIAKSPASAFARMVTSGGRRATRVEGGTLSVTKTEPPTTLSAPITVLPPSTVAFA